MPSVVKEQRRKRQGKSGRPTGSRGPAVAAASAGPAAGAAPMMVPRNCKLQPPYRKVAVPAFQASGELVAFASPDSTFAATRRLLDAARRTIDVGIYDFTAGYMADLLRDALARGVRVRLMLDTDSAKGEDAVFEALARAGVECVSAPSCASRNPAAKVFRSAHEKFVVIDGETCIVQSGNYTPHSIPLNTVDGGGQGRFLPGNRDMGVAVRSRGLAAFLTGILEADMALELRTRAGPAVAAAQPPPPPMLVERAPTRTPARLYPSKSFPLRKALEVQPVLSPDNYLAQVLPLLRGARRSVLIQQQYIHPEDAPVAALLEAIRDARARRPGLQVRIFLGKVFSKKDLPGEKANLAILAKQYGLRLGTHVRYVNTDRLVHCHNKLLVVDGKRVLVGSQNWSRSALEENREASLLLEHAGLARHFTAIFDTDWSTADKVPGAGLSPASVASPALARGGYLEVAPGDHRRV